MNACIDTIRYGLSRNPDTRQKSPIRRIVSETYRIRYAYRAMVVETIRVVIQPLMPNASSITNIFDTYYIDNYTMYS